ncbi:MULTISPECIES: hypothetical protein [Bacillaceae]|uniref:hypothetical protein n=1 Tax=Bacillaceae TaxID=186817 RepID=UPI00037E1EE4|nr:MULTISPECIES: hypothetical protein [Bacillaceae]
MQDLISKIGLIILAVVIVMVVIMGVFKTSTTNMGTEGKSHIDAVIQGYTPPAP